MYGSINSYSSSSLTRLMSSEKKANNKKTEKNQPHNTINKLINDKLDQQFVSKLTIIEQIYHKFNKHIQIRIQKWVERLLLCDQNTTYRRRRNLYIQLLAEMVQRDYIGFMFVRIPPDDVPNLTDNQYRIIMQQLVKKKKVLQQKHRPISITKIQEPQGDTDTCLVTPNCQTDRSFVLKHLEVSQKYKSRVQVNSSTSQKIQKIQTPQIIIPQQNNQKQNLEGQYCLDKLEKLLTKKSNTFSNSQEYNKILNALNSQLSKKSNRGKQSKVISGIISQRVCHQITNSTENQQESLKISQGINQINLSELLSPRQTAQIHYFKSHLDE